ncbi:hypothetical protein [Streptomyces sp. NPDC021608]|uniref:hypothetical protein n=1 Tax=Streptomyces sp. NPDC021608 TaxID=3154903 RepID=UPI0034053521
MIQFDPVHKRFPNGTTAVHDLSLPMPEGGRAAELPETVGLSADSGRRHPHQPSPPPRPSSTGRPGSRPPPDTGAIPSAPGAPAP